MTSIKQVFCWTRYMVWKKVREKITLWRRGISQRSWTSRSEAGNFSQAPSTCALEEAIHLENLSYSHQPPPHRCLPWFLLSGTSMLRLPRRLSGKECACQCRRQGFHPVSGRSHGEGNGHPLQDSCLGNSVDREDWKTAGHGVANETQLRD